MSYIWYKSQLLTFDKGCCSSRVSATDHSAPYAANQAHASSATPIAAQGQSPRLSTSSRQSAQYRRHLSPASRFNEPLKAHTYVSKKLWTQSRLERERRDFFDTRTSGRSEVWSCIRSAAELFRQGDVDTAQMMINASGLTVPTGNMVEGVYDSQGAYYQLPEWAVADPVNLQRDEDGDAKDTSTTKPDAVIESENSRKIGKGKGKAPPAGEGVSLKARLSDRATDIILTVYKTDPISDIVEKIKEEAGVSVSPSIDSIYH